MKRLPFALSLPKQPLRMSTANRIAHSAALFVGSTRSTSMNVKIAAFSLSISRIGRERLPPFLVAAIHNSDHSGKIATALLRRLTKTVAVVYLSSRGTESHDRAAIAMIACPQNKRTYPSKKEGLDWGKMLTHLRAAQNGQSK